jgi:hypothetical protein
VAPGPRPPHGPSVVPDGFSVAPGK